MTSKSRIRSSQMAILGGSGLGSGLLELLGLDFDFLIPPELGSGLLEPPGWILSPPGTYWGPSTNGYKRFSPPVLNLFSSTSHKHGAHHRMLCCRRSNINVSISTGITNICTIIQRYQLPTSTLSAAAQHHDQHQDRQCNSNGAKSTVAKTQPAAVKTTAATSSIAAQ